MGASTVRRDQRVAPSRAENGDGQLLHRMQRERRYGRPWRLWLRFTSALRIVDARTISRDVGVDGDAWYATDYVYMNQWPYSDQTAVPLPLTKRRRALQEYLKTWFDTELLAGMAFLFALYILYWYLATAEPEGTPPLDGRRYLSA